MYFNTKFYQLRNISRHWDGLQFFSEFWLFWFRLICGAPFTKLLDSFAVIFISTYIVTSDDVFHESRVLRSVVKHLSFDLYSTKFFQAVQIFWYESIINKLHTQNFNQNMLIQSIGDGEILCYLSGDFTTIFKHCFFFNLFGVVVFNRCEWIFRWLQDLHWMICATKNTCVRGKVDHTVTQT